MVIRPGTESAASSSSSFPQLSCQASLKSHCQLPGFLSPREVRCEHGAQREHRARRALYALRLILVPAAAALLVMARPAWPQPQDGPASPRLEDVRQYIEARGYGWTAGTTGVSGLTPDQYQKLLGGRVPEDYDRAIAEIRKAGPAYPAYQFPARFDWTDSAAVSPVRLQLCGDCWAQAAVAAMESRLRIYDGDTTLLSVQQAIDCNYGGGSCDGGFAGSVFDLHRVVGAAKEASNPYVGDDRPCLQDTCTIVARADGWTYVDSTVAAIKAHLLAEGPIPVGMAAYPDFAYYTGGCYEREGTLAANHVVLVVGWDDTLCDGRGAWHVKNSWGTDWGEDGYFWIKYGSCYFGVAALAVGYTPRQRVLLACDSYSLDDTSGDSDGRPDPGEAVVLPVSVRNTRWDTATSVSATLVTATPGVYVTAGSASFADLPQGAAAESDPPHFAFYVDPACRCGERIDFVISLACDQGVFTDHFDMLVGDAQTAFSDDAESDLLWSLSAPGDGATAGRWARKNPNGSLLDSVLVQCELDHTAGAGVMCFVTANCVKKYPVDAADVDGGVTTLTTPAVDLSEYASARLRYARWYSNDAGPGTPDDTWKVDVSADSGATWTSLEDQGAGRREWAVPGFDLGAYTALTDKVRVRFVASDLGQESTVEAGVDDVEITGCPHWVDVLAPQVAVAAPNGGEEVPEDTDCEVAWEASDDYGIRQFLVLASYDGGLTYPDTVGAAGGRDSTLVWRVPSGEHPACRVRVEALDRGYNLGADQSDATFAIVREGAGVPVTPEDGLPSEPTLVGSERNPFTGSTHIFFGLPEAAIVRIAVYDATGRVVRDLLRGRVEAGYHSSVWDARSDSGARAAPGVYFVRFETGIVSRTAKIVLVE